MTLPPLTEAALLAVILVSACWLLFMATITWAIVSTRGERARVAETSDEDPRRPSAEDISIPSSVRKAGAEARKAEAEADAMEEER